jgi:hypothetical protein
MGTFGPSTLRLAGVVGFGMAVWFGAAEALAGSAVVSQGAVGIVPGESIRVSVSNPAPQGSPAPLPALMTVHLLDTSGRDLAVSPVLTAGPGHTKTFVVKRASLPPAGDPETGRLEVRAEIYLAVPSLPPGQSQAVIVVTTVVDELTGRVSTRQSGMIGDIRTVISAEAQ